MFNRNPMLNRRNKNFGNPGAKNSGNPGAKNSGNPGASSSTNQPSLGTKKSSLSPLRLKAKTTLGGAAEGAIRSKGKGPALPPAKRPKPSGSEIKHGKGKPLCPHLLDIDPSYDLWHHPELGTKMLRHAIRDADLAYVRPQAARDLVDSAYCDLARLPVVLETLVDRAKAYENMRNKAEDLEDRCRTLTQDLFQLQLDRDSTRKQLEEELSDVRGKLKAETRTGRGYLDSLGGQRYLISQKEAAVLEYKKSEEFKSLKEAVVHEYKESEEFTNYISESSIPIFDECLNFCRERLVSSGRFPGETFDFLDPDWVEMINVPPSGDISRDVSNASSGAPDDDMIDIEGENANS